MILPYKSLKIIKEYSILLDQYGVNNFAFEKDKALDFLDSLRENTRVIVLGVEVLLEKDQNIISSHEGYSFSKLLDTCSEGLDSTLSINDAYDYISDLKEVYFEGDCLYCFSLGLAGSY
jgi:hypothetical protein